MPLLRLDTTIRAKRELCFDLARDVGSHTASTARTRERVVGGVSSGLMELGDVVTWEAVHFGVKQRLTAKITRLERPTVFVDEMVRGAFARFTHTHEFREAGGVTTMTDLFDYTSPLGPLGKLADKLFLARYMRRFLEDRARFLKATAEAAR